MTYHEDPTLAPERPQPTRSRADRPQVAIALPVAMPRFEQAFRGVIAYARAHTQWSFMLSPETHTLPVDWLEGWDGAGAIAMVMTPDEAAVARRLPMPVVTLSGALESPGVTQVTVDDEAVGRLAARHLLQTGVEHFAYYGLQSIWYAQQRGRGFTECLREAGHPCQTFEAISPLRNRTGWGDDQAAVEVWLQYLPKPVGILASTDHRARLLIHACERLGLAVPDEVAVVGVDNDLVTCEFTQPTLSSVDCASYTMGYHAAAALHQRMEDATDQPPWRKLLPPSRVIHRRSSDLSLVGDGYVQQAVRYVRDHIEEPFGVEALLNASGVSRRRLEYGFRTELGCTPHEYICQRRVERAKQMLLTSEHVSLRAVAEGCGFRDGRHLRRIFMRWTGQSPKQYGQQPAD
jgi:LacI family transcriptional regulator